MVRRSLINSSYVHTRPALLKHFGMISDLLYKLNLKAGNDTVLKHHVAHPRDILPGPNKPPVDLGAFRMTYVGTMLSSPVFSAGAAEYTILSRGRSRRRKTKARTSTASADGNPTVHRGVIGASYVAL